MNRPKGLVIKNLKPRLCIHDGGSTSRLCPERATDGGLQNEDWTLNMEICDIINETEEGPKDAMRALKKRLSGNRNFREVMLALTVLETCVKNCGHRFHVHVANRDFIDGVLVKIISPKTNPPTIVQDKVLALIQAWADAFRSCPDLTGVVHIYEELKRKGVEFPMADLDALSPIHTPQRIPHVPDASGPITANPEQIARLRSELDIVRGNTKVMSEMLTEMVPRQEDSSDLELLQELNRTCRAMQQRVVELISRVANEEMTEELLHVNDDLNNIFLRYERYERFRLGRTGQNNGMLAMGGLNVGMDGVSGTLSSISCRNPDDFDMFAQTRSSSLADQRKKQQNTGGGIPVSPSSVMDDIEEWLCADVKGDGAEEGVTSEEFDQFLEDRAKVGDSGPSPPLRSRPGPPVGAPSGSHKKAERTEDALFAL
ncbi:hypothetical protein NHX12_032494 [Muraenolepis orangiensis]|uniref:Target of myb1 like 2 membrane trafficking protein n=1 Tax=Muraenolepis orangiensis TaxID=630683 RepID=A0A9Q0ILK5_9TELE|nr:hypothetical protein NHX12_032494 [Muraenolepis orangiensis]